MVSVLFLYLQIFNRSMIKFNSNIERYYLTQNNEISIIRAEFRPQM